MKETLRLIITLSLICLISGALLAKVNDMTKDAIAAAKRAKKLDALENVLPAYDNEPDNASCVVTNNGRAFTCYIARKDGKFAGTAIETSSSAGYGGDISLMLGINADGKTKAIYILKQTETPGLGANIVTPKFKSNFEDKDIAKNNWSVKKDGGDVDQITAATISSRAVTGAVKDAIDAYLANIEKIKQTGK
jgi:electron transport complex protein RnfG